MEVILIATGIIAVGIYLDLRTKKVPNKISLALFIAAFILKIVLFGQIGMYEGLVGTGAVLALMIPLVIARALGAGDMKLMCAFGMITNWHIVFWTLIYSVIWGAILGVVRALISKQGQNLFMSTWSIIATKGQASADKMHTIPYTVALGFGFATYLVLKGGSISVGFMP